MDRTYITNQVENFTTELGKVSRNSHMLESSSHFLETTGTEKTDLDYLALLLIPLIVAIALGNVMVIVLVGVDRRLRSATNYFLSSLAVADMLVALTVMPPSLAMIANNYKWPFSDTLCGLWIMLDVFFSTASILHLCMISFDRYMALALPFKRKNSRRTSLGGSIRSGPPLFLGQDERNKWKHVAKRVGIVWSIALGIAVPIPVMGKLDRNNLFVDGLCAINMAKFQIFGSLVAFFLPLIIMFIMYTLTIRNLNQQAQMVSNIIVHSGRNSPQLCRRKSTQRRSSSITQMSDVREDVYTLRQFEHQKNSCRADYGIYATEETIEVFQHASPRCSVCAKTRATLEKYEQERSWRKTLIPVYHALNRLCGIISSRCHKQQSQSNENVAEQRIRDETRCTCIERRDNNRDDIGYFERESAVNVPRRQSRKIRHSQRRVSSSFKNRAMASISNEQRASKVLGLIFVLFCVFWCPFFITNVTSGLCTSCNQQLMGNLMNWFVWVGYVSSGVNPCVYTMFSRRFRETFLLFVKGRVSEISKRSSIKRSSFSNISMKATRSRTSSLASSRTSVVSFPQTKENEKRPSFSQNNTDEIWVKNIEAATSFKTNFFRRQSNGKRQTFARKDRNATRNKLWRWSTSEKCEDMHKIPEETHDRENLLSKKLNVTEDKSVRDGIIMTVSSD